jgi:hypothetical protein
VDNGDNIVTTVDLKKQKFVTKNRMKNHIKTLAILSALAVATSVQAQITYSSSGTTSAWLGSPVYTTSLSGLSAQGEVQSGALTYGVLAEMFTPSSGFTLGGFNVIDSVNTADTYQVGLFDLGPAGTVSVSSSAATYTPGANLFSVTSVSLPTSGQVQGEFTLPVADQVSLLAGEEYALEIWTPVADVTANGFIWYRGSTADPGGQMFSAADVSVARKTLAGNGQAGGAPRTGALALYQVPEPASMTLLGLGALVGTLVIRRRK